MVDLVCMQTFTNIFAQNIEEIKRGKHLCVPERNAFRNGTKGERERFFENRSGTKRERERFFENRSGTKRERDIVPFRTLVCAMAECFGSIQ